MNLRPLGYEGGTAVQPCRSPIGESAFSGVTRKHPTRVMAACSLRPISCHAQTAQELPVECVDCVWTLSRRGNMPSLARLTPADGRCGLG